MSLLYLLDLFGTAVFAISGVWLACRKDMDIFGVMVLAFVTAVGGGTIRDCLLGATPVFWITDTLYLVVILSATFFAVLIRRWHVKSHWILQVSDALGLAVFAVVGITKALAYGADPMVATMMGVLTGCGGGAIRDILSGEVPGVLTREIYAGAAMVGGIVYVSLQPLMANTDVLAVVTALIVLVIRLLAMYKNLSLPRFGLPD